MEENQDIKFFPIKKFPDINVINLLKLKMNDKKKNLKIKVIQSDNKIKLNK